MADEGGRDEVEWKGPDDDLPGIVIADGRAPVGPAPKTRIAAFIWGGEMRVSPTLPFGRWKGAA